MGKKVLLIPKGFLGDVLLTTPTIAALKQGSPDTHVSVVCSPTTAEFVRRDPLVDAVIVYDRRTTEKGFAGIRSFAERLKNETFDVAYAFHRSPRTAIMLRMAGIPQRIAYSDSYGRFLYTRTVRKDVRLHEVLRNVSLVEGELSEQSRSDFKALAEAPDAQVSWADIRVPKSDNAQISQVVAEFIASPEPYVVLSPGSAWETKRWHTDGFRAVARALDQRSVRVIVVGAPSDRNVCQQVVEGTSALNVCGQTSIEDLISLVRGASCVVCNDSLALHVCSATKTPAVAVFCATSPRFGFGPWRNRAVVLEKSDLFCKPCRRHGSRSCPTGTNACMTGVSSAEVVCAVDAFLGQQGSRGPAGCLRVVES